MNVNLTRRCLSMLTVLVMLFTMMPTTVLAEEVHDHDHETTDSGVSVITVEALSVSASASANHVYAGEGTVTVTAKISGGMAPYEVTLQAVKDGSVLFTDTTTTESSSVKLNYTPASYGDYELVVTVHDALHTQDLTSVSLAVAERDAETEAEWAASVSGASVSSNWAKSLLSVAKTQVGYAESEKDFILKSGEKQGYSRYGAWYGTPYAGWNVSFLAFAAEYAKIPNDALLSGSSYRSWVNGFSNKGAYMTSDYTPKAGDIAFLSGSRVAIVESVNGSNITVIEGDVNGAVARKSYAISKVVGFGNSELMQGLYNGTATAVPTAAPEATKAPETGSDAEATAAPTATPVATPVPEEEELVFQATPTPGPGVTVAPKDDSDPLQNVSDAMDKLVDELDAAATAIPAEFSEAYYLMQAEIHKLMEKYLGTANPTKAEIEAFVEGLEMADLYYILMEFEDLIEFALTTGCSEHEISAVLETQEAYNVLRGKVQEKYGDIVAVRANYSFADGKLTLETTVDSTSSLTGSNYSFSNTTNSITSGVGITAYSTNNSTLTFTNASDSYATVSFSYTLDTGTDTTSGTRKVSFDDGTSHAIAAGGSTTGTYSKLLAPNETITITQTTTSSHYKRAWGYLRITNLTFVETSGSEITFQFDEGTVFVDNEEVASGDSVFVAATGATLVGNPPSGKVLTGWVNADTDEVVELDNGVLKPLAPMTLKPVFSEATLGTWQVVGGSKYFDLNLAIAAAVNGGQNTIVLAADGTLPAGTYTIPSGVTVLIPFDDEHTLYTTEPGLVKASSDKFTTSIYRTLTMAEGATLNIEGAMSLSNKVFAGGGGQDHCGSPYGALSMVQMESGSAIDVKNDGALYVYGFITGEGNVTVQSGATVYECFQFEGFRGGSQSSDMANKVFPYTQYYIQNVEVPMRIYAGAKEYSYSGAEALEMAAGTSVAFLSDASGAMFRLSSGYVEKTYDGSTDRLMVKLGGDGVMSVSPIVMSLSIFSIDAADYILPITHNITIQIESGSEVSLAQDIAMLPGSKIIIDEGATCKLNTNNTVILYDSDAWGPYCFGGSAKFIPVRYAPGRTYTRTDADLVDAAFIVNGTVDATPGSAFTTTSGANITSDGDGIVKIGNVDKDTTVTYQYQQETSTYHEIGITSAMLKNADGSYTKTGEAPANLYSDLAGTPITSGDGTYKYDNGVWQLWCDGDAHVYTRSELVPQSCTEGGHYIYNCKCGEAAKDLKVYNTVESTDENGETVYVPQGGKGHTEVVDAAVAATCTTTGLTEGKHCSVCGTVTEAQTVTAVLDHTADEAKTENEVPATCTTAGSYDTVVYCSVCGAEISRETVTVDKLGHDYDTNDDGTDDGTVTPPTCTEDGYTTYICTRCEDGTKIGNKVDKLGHTFEAEGAVPSISKPATCTKFSYQKWECERCPEILEQYGTQVNGHSYEADVVEATCQAPGYILYTCTVCEKEEGYQFRLEWNTPDAEIPSAILELLTNFDRTTLKQKDHTPVTIPAVAPTCTQDGTTEGEECSVCGAETKSPEVDPATGHKYEELTDKKVSATCTTPGKRVFKCANSCAGEVPVEYSADVSFDSLNLDKTIALTEDDYEALAPTGHTYSCVYNAPTCEDEGSFVFICACGDKQSITVKTTADELALLLAEEEIKTAVTEQFSENFDPDTDLDPLDHTEGTPVIENDVPATCTTAGSYDTVVYCAVCSTEAQPVELSRVKTDVDALGHTYGEAAYVASNCEKDGTITFTCSKCTATEENEGVIVIRWNTEVDDLNTEAQAAYAAFVAANEGFEQRQLQASGHDYAFVAKVDASCNQAGSITYTCQNGDTCPAKTVVVKYEDENTDYDALFASYHTDIQNHLTENYVGEMTKTKFFETLKDWGDHNHVGVPTPETCLIAGYTTYTCSKCGDTYVEPGAAQLEHNYTAEIVSEDNSNNCTAVRKIKVSCDRGCNDAWIFTADEVNNVEMPDEARAKVTDELLAQAQQATHEYEYVDNLWKSQTCTESGEEGFVCSKCFDEVIVTCYTDYEDLHPTIQAYFADKWPGWTWTEIQEALEPYGHEFDEGEDGEIANCAHEGTIIFTCSNNTCDSCIYTLAPSTYNAETVPAELKAVINQDLLDSLAQKDHSYTVTVAAQPTCTEQGKLTVSCDQGCGYVSEAFTPAEFEAGTVSLPEGADTKVTEFGFTAVEVKGHKWAESARQQPTCTAEGSITYVCANDAAHTYTLAPSTYEESEAPAQLKAIFAEAKASVLATDHDYVEDEEQYVAPTCTASGKRVFVCDNSCEGTVEVTYTEGGYVNLHATIQTALTEQAYDDLQPTGHNYDWTDGDNKGTVITQPTCLANGYITKTCNQCESGEGHVVVVEYDANSTDEAILALAQKPHNFAENVATENATCAAEGSMTFTCTNGCDVSHVITPSNYDEKSDEVKALVTDSQLLDLAKKPHVYDWTDEETGAKGTVTYPATCGVAGYIIKTCKNCAADVDGHEVRVDYDATSTDPDISALKPLEHEYTSEVTTQPTCTQKGEKTYTCTQPNGDDTCGHTYTEDVAELGHNYGEPVKAERNCEDDGSITFTCTVCTAEANETDRVVVIYHDTDISTLNDKAQEAFEKEYPDFDLGTLEHTGHEYKATVTAPTCTEQGYTTHTCQNEHANGKCDDEYVDTYVAATGHKFDYEGGVATKVEVSCTVDGELLLACKDCDFTFPVTVATPKENLSDTMKAVLGADYDPAVALAMWNHSDVTNYPEDAEKKCTGYLSAGTYCNLCKTWIVERVTLYGDHVPNKNQSAAGSVYTAPTCTEDGYWTYKCYWCDETTVEVAANSKTNHAGKVYHEQKDATCTEDGYTEGYFCQACEDREEGTGWIEGHTVIPATGHTFTADRHEPSCEVEGYIVYTCKKGCTYTLKPSTYAADKAAGEVPAEVEEQVNDELMNSLAALAHNWSEETTAATCTKDSFTVKKCLTVGGCGAVQTTPHENTKLDHEWSAWTDDPANTATCTEAGQEISTCTRENCDGIEAVKYQPKAALGHTYMVNGELTDGTVTQFECGKPVITVYNCEREGCADPTYTHTSEEVLAHDIKYDVAVPATCITDGVAAASHCERDGCTYTTGGDTIPALGHNYMDGTKWVEERCTEYVKPTCTEAGYKVYTCTREGCTETTQGHVSEQVPVAKLGHEWSSVKTDPDCENDGKIVFTCVRGCEYTLTVGYDATQVPEGIEAESHIESITALNHKNAYDTDEVAPTCTNIGYTAGKYCPDCDAYIEGHDEVAANGHTWTSETTVPTCTAPGYITCTCTVDGCDGEDVEYIIYHDTDLETVVLPKNLTVTSDEVAALAQLDHKIESKVTEPTCTADGYTEYWCPVTGEGACNYYEKITDTDSKLGHNMVATDTVVTADCVTQTDGYTVYKCDRTGCFYTEPKDFVLWTTVHTYNQEAADCVTPLYCVKCQTADNPTTPALGHDETGAEATCLTDKVCARPGCNHVLQSALGHEYLEAEKNATCIDRECQRCHVPIQGDGKHAFEDADATCIDRECTLCGNTIEGDGKHAFEDADATCIDRECTLCGNTVEGDGQHSFEDADATCIDRTCLLCNGMIAGDGQHSFEDADATCIDRTCLLCNGKIVGDGKHNYEQTGLVESTCVTPGTKTETCKLCGDVVTTELELKTEHTYSDAEDAWTVDVEPTCQAAGSKYRVCTVDGCDEKDTAEIPVVPCSYNSVYTAATCGKDGFTTYTCKWCSDTYTEPSETDKATGNHSFEDADATCIDRVCTVCGNTVEGDGKHDYEDDDATCIDRTCLLCGGVAEKTTVHDYDVVIVESTCVTPGTKTETCKLCGDVVTTELELKTEHTYSDDEDAWTVDVEPTCQAAGSKYRVCTVDGCNEQDTAEIPVVSCSYNSVYTAATCGKDGFTTYTCKWCGDTYTETSETDKATGAHQYDEEIISDSTCTELGEKKLTCSVCGDSYTAEIAKKEHVYKQTGSTPKTCETHGVLTFTCQNDKCGDVVNVTYNANTNAYYRSLHSSIQTALKTPNAIRSLMAGHNDTTTVVQPTCTANGYTQKQCSVCSRIEITNETAMIDHTYTSEVTTPSTCKDYGVRTYTCTACGDTKTEPEPLSTVHQYATLNQAPTCTESGYKGGQRCSVCGVDSTANPPQIDPATGHDYGYEYTEPKCTTDGKVVFTCQNGTCGSKLEVTVETTAETLAEMLLEDEIKAALEELFGADFDPAEDLKALGHDIITDKAQAPTCTEDGLLAGQHCSRCDDETIEQAIDPKLGHQFAADEKDKECIDRFCERCKQTIKATADHQYTGAVTTEPTCAAEGVKTFTCTVCGDTYTESVDKVPHSYNAVVTDPTCLADGYTTYTCSECGDTYTDDIVKTNGHAWGEPVVTPNTCGKDGFTTKTCSACGEVETYDETLATGNHTYGDWVETMAPTCTEEGEKQQTCTVCGNTATGTVETKEHLNDITIDAIAPECGKAGWTEGKKCSACGQTTVAPEIVKALQHNWVAYDYKAPTCTEDGNANNGSYCTLCGAVDAAATVLPATNHKNQTPGAAKDPTCTEAGNTAGLYCPDCDTWLEEQEEIPATDHANKAPGEAKDPTCTEAGNTAGLYCPDCDTWLEEQEEIPATDHANKAPGEAKDPTCTEAGNTAGLYCPDCDTWLEAQEAIDATGHNMDEGVEDPKHTCTTAGVMTYTCLNGCGYTETEEVLAAHTPEVIPAVPHTCTEDGLTEGSKCAVCGEILVAQEVDPAAHDWEDVTIHKEATCLEDGSKDVRCTADGCGATDTIVIPAPGHMVVIDPAKAATCTVDGLTEGKHCSVCEEVLVAQEVIKAAHTWSIAPCTNANAICIRCGKTNGEELLPHNMAAATCTKPATCTYAGCGYTEGEALGHKLVDIDEIPVTCEQSGWTAGVQCTVCGAYTTTPKEIPAFNHKNSDGTSAISTYPAKNPTFTSEGWYEYEACSRCNYSTKKIREKLPDASIDTFEEFITYLPKLEEWAVEYSRKTPGTDPVSLVIKYIRTGVDRYNSGSWGIMAGYEDKGFAEYVIQQEDAYNAQFTEEQQDQMLQVSGFKDMKEFYLPNGNFVDFGHMFGTMDITYTNTGSQNHADVGGWAGDLVDLLSTSDHESHQDLINSVGDDFEALVDIIRTDLLGYDFDHEDTFALNDIYGDLDAFYIMENLDADGYAGGDLAKLCTSYFDASLSAVTRADYLLANRFDDVRTRSAIREAVYTEYTTNAMISTLEGTRDFVNTEDLITRRKAVCYAFADYLCILAGDWVDDTDNPYLTDYESSYSLLAPGISMEIHKATSQDGKNMVYYLGYADLAREDVDVMINYHDRYVDEGWNMSRVLDQANKAADKYYANPESEHYIENFAPVVAVNGAGFDMGTGEPSGLMVMHGEEYHPINANGFFGITKSGKAIIGTTDEYNSTYKGQLAEGIAGFGTMLVVDGELYEGIPTTNYYSDRASRTAVGITATGRVVFMVLDGRQEPWSCGGSMIEIAQIMKLAGCVTAVNMDGGGSTTFVARKAGDEELSLVNRPSDGVQRSVSTSMMMVSTAPSSKTFDSALVASDYNFMTVGAEVNVTATGLSATNNIVALPEGATWAVSDPEMAEIVDTGDVVINEDDPTVTKKTAKVIAKKNGEFEVYLMLDGVIIGQKTLNVIVPDQIYFTREKIDGIYGQGVELPLKARYEGKEAAFVPEDVVFTISNPAVGEMDGLTFNVAEESTVKTVTVTAALALNAEATASINVVLYKDGENNFNFDNATGGNRELAWLREVSNAKQEGTSTYYIIDPNEDMVTTYTVALDMSQIPIPEKLESLTYMLPGSDLEGASAWTFLLQLAERISELTTVTATFTIDSDLTLIGYDEETGTYDASGLSLINDYFVLNKEAPVVYNPTENTLTLKLNWKGFSQAIDPETANPMCIVSGLKLVPNDDAAWDDKDRLSVKNTAVVGYKVYMRANALHTFSSKPENQETFGLYPYGPYTNSRGIVENGGWFQSTYAQFEDSYTLIKSLKNGWVIEEGGFRYYIDGQYLKGIHQIADDGLFYQFDENGINIGQTPYTGLHKMDGYTYYMQNGTPYQGWITLDDGNWYLFTETKTPDETTGRGINGTHVVEFSGNRIVYEFDNGRLLDGVWYHDGIGWRYYYGPYYYKQGWRELTSQDGEKEMYFFEAYYVQDCTSPVQEAHAIVEYWYEFTDEGVLVGNAPTGLYWWDDDWYKGDAGTVDKELYYVVENLEGNGYSLAVTDGLHLIDGDYYYFDLWTGQAFRNKSAWISQTNDLLPEGTYRFADDGKIIMKTGVFNEDGTLYYYLNGKRTANAGMVEYEGNIYGVGSGAICYVSQSAYINKDNGLAAGEGTYRFDENGHLIVAKAVVNEDGTLYYYHDNGKRKANAGLVEFGGDIYYIGAYTADGATINNNTAIAATDAEINVASNKTNGLLPAGTYRFDADGKAILTTELVEGNDGKLYYYLNGALQKDAGLIKYEGDYYYIDANGAAVTDTEMLVEKTIDPFPVDTYEFGSDGKMIIREGIYEGYYYVGGIKTAAGLVEEDGNYYYAAEGGKILIDTKYDVQKTNDLLPAGTYRINEDGTVNLSTELADEDGTLVYYKDGLLTANAGLIEIDGDYYYIVENGVAVADTKHKVTITNGLKPAGTYRFAEDGKMILTTELAEEADGKLYYYIDGRMADKADLIKYDGAYYWIEVNGFAVTNTKISLGTGELLPTGVYRVGADGKVILTTELVVENGNKVYYKNGILTTNAGLIECEGDYYYIGAYVADGKTFNNNTAIAVVDAKVDVTTAKTNNLLPAGTYRFDEEGKAILTTEVALEDDGKYYYYVDGLLTKDAGLIEYEDAYYYITEDGTALTDAKVDVAGSDLLDDGTYRAGSDAKIILTTEIVKESDGKYYYYENGKLGKDAGLVAYNGYYYYITANGTAVTNDEMDVEKTNDLLPAGIYRFDAEGKADLATELVEGEDGKLYYYVNGALAEDAGLIEYDGAYYYITAEGTAVTGTEMLVEKTNNLFPVDTYEFGEDGKMVIREGIYEGYYYVGGVKTAAGLVQEGDDYYYAGEGGKLVTDAEIEVVKTNDLKPEGVYRFDEEGKMIQTTELVEKDGELYYYEDGKLGKDAGLILYEGDYYYIDENGTAVTDTKMLVEKTNDLLPEDTYCFGADGKMFERLPGDANDDQTVDLDDALLVLEYDSTEGVKINLLNADVNGDGLVDINDALLLMQYCSGWDVELI